MKTGFIVHNNKVYVTLLAISEEEQAKGLMYQKYPHPNMAFLYSKPQNNKFWMKNTPSALDIVFCKDNTILSIKKGQPFSTQIIDINEDSDLVLEFPFGTCASDKIQVGDTISIFSKENL